MDPLNTLLKDLGSLGLSEARVELQIKCSYIGIYTTIKILDVYTGEETNESKIREQIKEGRFKFDPSLSDMNKESLEIFIKRADKISTAPLKYFLQRLKMQLGNKGRDSVSILVNGKRKFRSH